MKKKITMPALKPDMKEGILCRWNVEPGDTVYAGDAIFEVETDKAVTEVEAEAAGTVCNIFVDEGDTAAPGTILGEIEVED